MSTRSKDKTYDLSFVPEIVKWVLPKNGVIVD